MVEKIDPCMPEPQPSILDYPFFQDNKVLQSASCTNLPHHISLANSGLWLRIMLITSAHLIMGSLMALMFGFILCFIGALNGGCPPHRLLQKQGLSY